MTRNASRWAKLLGVFVLLTVVSTSFAASGAAQQGGGKALRIHQVLYPETADPQKSSFSGEIAFLVANYEGLTRLDKDGQTAPAAAERWSFNADGTVLTFTLRPDLTYSDGSPLTAERFRYAVERACDPNTAGDYQYVLFDVVGCQEWATLYAEDAATPVARDDTAAYEAARAALGVTAVDDRTLEIQLKQPAPYFPSVAGLWVFFPAKQELIAQGGEAWWTDPALQVGNGPLPGHRHGRGPAYHLRR
jgi:oligopeptide transport system substrate-binding protein